jgi:hypothetical protein
MSDDTNSSASYGLGKRKLYRAIHLFWMLLGSQDHMASRLDVSLSTVQRACRSQQTSITLDDVKRAARQYVREHESECDQYRWAAVSAVMQLIDPAAVLAYTRSAKGDKLTKAVEDHVRMNQMVRGLSYTVWWYSSRHGYRKKHIRQIIKRAIKRDPTLRLRQIEGGKDEIDDPINAYQVVVPDVWAAVDAEEKGQVATKVRTPKQADKVARRNMRQVKERAIVMQTKKTSRGKSLTITTAGAEE